MKTYSFKVVVEPDEDAAGNPAWYAYCPALESIGGATSGRTREEALKNINEVVHMIVQEFIEDVKPLPEGPDEDMTEADKQKQREFFNLAERFRKATNPQDVKRLGDQLGRTVFGLIPKIRESG
jgi:predicted RNase H-like HicB family nuclease